MNSKGFRRTPRLGATPRLTGGARLRYSLVSQHGSEEQGSRSKSGAVPPL